jgi:SAM-dependent methyltransferase
MLQSIKRYGRKILFSSVIRRKEIWVGPSSGGPKAASPELGCLTYRCNICGHVNEKKMVELTREEPSCKNCGSTTRMRSIIYLLSIELFGKSLALPDFPVRPDIVGIGMSDWERYALPLAHKLTYKNTYYHQQPQLDITRIDPKLENTLDFLISSDVFEHVSPPVSMAFENAHKLLKPNGVFIFTVPYSKHGQTEEHFPELYDYQVIERDEHYILKNFTEDGREQVFEDLVFHGGAGLTVEMRVFSEEALMEEFDRAGFSGTNIHREPDFEHGIFWHQDWSLPITARK